MWGNIVLEVSFLSNFHLSFNNTRTDVLIHLIQWQYWWWFWFSYWWGLYFLLFIKIFRFRLLNFRPKIVTSYRSHGKWGDLLICFIPISWCTNIISNSNFILKMIEWQAESSLFTLRIRGRQWYWIYKYDLKILTDLISIPKNIGHNHWQFFAINDLETSDDYLHILQLRMGNKWLKNYWTDFLERTTKESSFNIISTLFPVKVIFPDMNYKSFFFCFKKKNFFFNFFNYKVFFEKNTSLLGNIFLKNENILNNLTLSIQHFNKKNFFKIEQFFFKNQTLMNKNNYLYHYDNFIEVTRWTKRTQGTIAPCRLIKYPTNNFSKNSFLKKHNLFKLRFNDDFSNLKHKPAPIHNYLVIKQKKYKPLKTVLETIKYFRNEQNTKQPLKTKYFGRIQLLNNVLFKDKKLNFSLHYKFLKKNKFNSEFTSIVLWKRLLRTKRTLVLPAHINITAITNSYDVIHSWFIPGLGMKMDCVPGRATHHVLHIDSVGFYYGQCAEICGRYHHHMPIRICALPFEHFLLWWHTFGLQKILGVGTNQRRFTKIYSLRKYIW